MTTATSAATRGAGIASSVFTNIIAEGYGTGAWHGPDLAAALSDVTAKTAFVRPARGRHNIAEIALHHAWTIRSVTAQLGGTTPREFPLEGEDWFEADGEADPKWNTIRAILTSHQEALAKLVADVAAGRATSPLPEAEQFKLILGVTCPAVYHAGQIQLVKKLIA